MAFTNEELKFTLQKAQEIQKWTDLVQKIQDLPSGYDTLTYRLSIRTKLNLNIILDRLRLDRKDGFAQQVEIARDNLFNEVKAYDRNYNKNNQLHLPDITLCDTADRLVILLRKIFNDNTEDSKKLSMYADNIEELVSDNSKLYPAIWKKQFEILLNIAVGYDLFDALLARIEEKDKTAGTQLKAKYQQLKQISDVDNAKEKELKESAAFDLVSLMREIAESPAGTAGKIKLHEKGGQSKIISNAPSIKKAANIWTFSFNNNNIPIADRIGSKYIAFLLTHPGEYDAHILELKVFRWENKIELPGKPEDIDDGLEISETGLVSQRKFNLLFKPLGNNQLNSFITILENERDSTEKQSEKDKCDEDIAKIKQYLKTAHRPGGDGKPIAKTFSTDQQKAARRLQKNYKDVDVLIKKDHEKLSEHLKVHMHFGVKCWYRPPDNFSWEFF